MPTLRERQKKERSAAIVAAADKLFHTRGYTKTSMEDIAEKANVGVATVYNYFGTKFDLLRTMMEPEIQRVKDEVDALFENLPEDPLEGIVGLTRCYTIGPMWRNKQMLEPFAKDYFLLRKGKANTFREISEMRIKHFRKLFKHYKSVGSIDKDMNEDDAIFVISGLFFLQLRDLMLIKSESPSHGIESLERRTRFVFTGLVK